MPEPVPAPHEAEGIGLVIQVPRGPVAGDAVLELTERWVVAVQDRADDGRLRVDDRAVGDGRDLRGPGWRVRAFSGMQHVLTPEPSRYPPRDPVVVYSCAHRHAVG